MKIKSLLSELILFFFFMLLYLCIVIWDIDQAKKSVANKIDDVITNIERVSNDRYFISAIEMGTTGSAQNKLDDDLIWSKTLSAMGVVENKRILLFSKNSPNIYYSSIIELIANNHINRRYYSNDDFVLIFSDIKQLPGYRMFAALENEIIRKNFPFRSISSKNGEELEYRVDYYLLITRHNLEKYFLIAVNIIIIYLARAITFNRYKTGLKKGYKLNADIIKHELTQTIQVSNNALIMMFRLALDNKNLKQINLILKHTEMHFSYARRLLDRSAAMPGVYNLDLRSESLKDLLIDFFEDAKLFYKSSAIIALKTEHKKSVLIDKEFLTGVFINLLKNALVHGSITNNRIEIHSYDTKNYVAISIANRKGNDRKLKIVTQFEPYSKSENSEGSGLGLFYIKKIIELHGGTISSFYGDDLVKFAIFLPTEMKVNLC